MTTSARYPIHPLAQIFPAMTSDEYAELRDSIGETGLQQPITVWQGQIIDGMHRYQACLEMQREAHFRFLEDSDDPVAYVISANINRRHLDASQRGIIGYKLSQWSKRGGRRELYPRTGRKSAEPLFSDKSGKPFFNQKEAARLLNIDDKTIYRAGKIFSDDGTAAPELRVAVESGGIKLTDAEKVIDEPPEVQRRAVEMVVSGNAKNATNAVREIKRSDLANKPVVLPDSPTWVSNATRAVNVGQRSRVVFSDNLDTEHGILALPDESIALTFTSPPYWNFVEYGQQGVGCESSYQDYICSLEQVFIALWKKTAPGGRAVVNVSNMKSRQDVEGSAFVYPIVADVISIMGNAGFTFFDEIIWHKGNANAGALDGVPLWGSYPYPPTPKILDSTFENIMVFTKPGQRNVTPDIKEHSRLTLEDWREYTKGIWELRHDRDQHHPATFPMEIANRIVRLYSFVGDLVVDPFAGSGTTVVAAEKNLRTGVGFEISPAYETAVQHKGEQWLTT